ncbi:unnamed protein product, partial [Rodentolepis nana]|uniref:MYND-type domain-containing protein n=1 Tax=Rodentolepis nana TaxID=102285 RepID=A0A0R3TTD3_RODNA
YILVPNEAEAFVEALKFQDYSLFGTESWYKQHAYLDKLNMQAVASARSGTDEFVKEFIISHQKIGFLVRDLISTELWHRNSFNKVLKKITENIPTFPTYAVLYHELILTNLLETISYHVDVVDSLSDCAIDLSDWCYRALCRLVTMTVNEEKKATIRNLKDQTKSSESSQEELERQASIINFEISMKAIALTCHLIGHCCSGIDGASSSLPLGVSRRILHTHDFLCLLCNILILSPWSCQEVDSSGCRTNYQWHESGCWIAENEKNWSSVTKTEGQVWLSIYQLLFSGLMREMNYEIIGNSVRRQALLSLRPLLTETRLDVIPVLGKLRRFLEEYAMSESAATNIARTSGPKYSAVAVAQLCHIEDVAEIHDGILHRYRGKWKAIAEEFIANILSQDGCEAAKRAALNWADAFSEENVGVLFGAQPVNVASGEADSFEHPLLRAPRCVVCREVATKRCSRCKHEWYCRRQCQVEHWPRHKTACDILVSANDN